MADSVHYEVEGPWTPMQIAFVSAYFDCEGDKGKAAALAGSKSKAPGRVGWEIANRDHVAKAIAKETPKRLKSFAEKTGLELLYKLRSWVLADRSQAYNEYLEPRPTNEWPVALRQILTGVSAQSTADGSVIRQPKFATPDSVTGLFVRALELTLARTDLPSEILVTPVEVAKIVELRSATHDRIQAALSAAQKLDDTGDTEKSD